LVDPSGISPFLRYLHSDLSRIVDKDTGPELCTSPATDIEGDGCAAIAVSVVFFLVFLNLLMFPSSIQGESGSGVDWCFEILSFCVVIPAFFVAAIVITYVLLLYVIDID